MVNPPCTCNCTGIDPRTRFSGLGDIVGREVWSARRISLRKGNVVETVVGVLLRSENIDLSRVAVGDTGRGRGEKGGPAGASSGRSSE